MPQSAMLAPVAVMTPPELDPFTDELAAFALELESFEGMTPALIERAIAAKRDELERAAAKREQEEARRKRAKSPPPPPDNARAFSPDGSTLAAQILPIESSADDGMEYFAPIGEPQPAPVKLPQQKAKRAKPVPPDVATLIPYTAPPSYRAVLAQLYKWATVESTDDGARNLVRVSVNGLAKKTGRSPRTAKRALAALRDWRIIRPLARGNPDGLSCSAYELPVSGAHARYWQTWRGAAAKRWWRTARYFKNPPAK